MLIKAVQVRNFRSILDETLPCEMLTALVGPNGAGKSSFLRAIELFYDAGPRLTSDDFYAEEVDADIEIAVTFADLTPEEKVRFASYVQGEELTVVRVLSMASARVSAKYHGSTLQNPDFAAVRDAPTARDATARYREIRQRAEYSDLADARSGDARLAALREWEAAYPDRCVRGRDDGQFFGFTEVAQGYLGRHTRFISIPAVRDVGEDAAEAKGSPITELMDLVVRSALAGRQEFAAFNEETDRKYREIMDPERLTEIQTLANQLTATLRTYVPDASVTLTWIDPAPIEIPTPQASVKLVEDGFPATVARTGHGLQRAFVLAMLQQLAAARGRATGQAQSSEAQEELPNLILAIEEPELYQHPSRQRHFARILLDLANGTVPGVAQRTQIIYATHSPLFVGIDRFDQVRLVRKVPREAGRPKCSKVVSTSLEEVAQTLWEARGRPGGSFNAQTLRPRLQNLMTQSTSEGFFADVVVLLEGEEDRAGLLGVALAMGHDLESLGFCVIPCGGKKSLDRPAAIFRKLGIPTYVIWDNDQDKSGADPADNRILLRLLGQPEEDWPVAVSDRFACFNGDLGSTLRQEVGLDFFDSTIQSLQAEAGMRKEQARKNPMLLRSLIEASKVEGRSSPTIEGMVAKILCLKSEAVRNT